MSEQIGDINWPPQGDVLDLLAHCEYKIDVCSECGERVLAKGYGCQQLHSAGSEVIEVVPADHLAGAVEENERLREEIRQHRAAVLRGGEAPNYVDEALWAVLDQPGGR